MALSKLSGDEQGILFCQLCNVLDPRIAVALSSVSHELREPTLALLPQLRADHEVAAALCHKMGIRSCKELREAKEIVVDDKNLSAINLATLGTLGSVLPALESLVLIEDDGHPAGPEGVQWLAAGLGAGALPSVTDLQLVNMNVSDAGASALAAALDRGALPRLKSLGLAGGAVGDAGLVALVPALRRRPALEELLLAFNPLGDEGLATLVAPPPPPPAGALSPPAGVLTKLKRLYLTGTQVSDAGCAALIAALDSGVLPPLELLELDTTSRASAAAKAAVHEALAKSKAEFCVLDALLEAF